MCTPKGSHRVKNTSEKLPYDGCVGGLGCNIFAHGGENLHRILLLRSATAGEQQPGPRQHRQARDRARHL